MELKQTCLICGKEMDIIIQTNEEITGGVYFGTFELPVGDGEWENIGVSNIGAKYGIDCKIDIGEWTGENKEIEFWECNDCYTEADELDEIDEG